MKHDTRIVPKLNKEDVFYIYKDYMNYKKLYNDTNDFKIGVKMIHRLQDLRYIYTFCMKGSKIEFAD